MNPKIHLRLMTQADLAFADGLRALVGWNQTLHDWQRFLAHEPTGCFIAEWDGSPAGTATTTCYGTELAWIGMVLVHPDYRRRGIGLALLRHCLNYLRDIPCIKLDATPLGKPLYEQLGFQEEWSLRRWEGICAIPARPGSTHKIQPWDASLADAVERLDQQAFGVSRRPMRERLAKESRLAVMGTGPDGTITGYGMLREGARALYLGPVTAESAAVGTILIAHLAAHADGRAIYWDVPDGNAAAVELARSLGLRPQRQLLRMYRGQNRSPGNLAALFAIADPAIG